MKKFAFVFAASIMLFVNGCKSFNFFVIDPDKEIQQSQTQSGFFSDDTYIWESWIFSTNQVYEVK